MLPLPYVLIPFRKDKLEVHLAIQSSRKKFQGHVLAAPVS